MTVRQVDFQKISRNSRMRDCKRRINASQESVSNQQNCTTIRAIAVSAPDWISGSKSEVALNSTDPASLFNACRYAAYQAIQETGAWADSNWSVSRSELRSKFLLMYSLDDMPLLDDILTAERPNLLFIGAMTLCMPGAIACAKRAKDLLGDDVLVVLGGRHVTETVYLPNERVRDTTQVRHHSASPARLIENETIPPVFDIVISGDGEHIIAAIGEAVARVRSVADLDAIADQIALGTPGNWIAEFPNQQRTIVSSGVPIRYDTMPSIAKIFGVSASFDVFEGRMTSHVFSDTGRGCVYDCAFCSERRSVTGGIQDIRGAPLRLYQQLADSAEVIGRDYPGIGASAFVEDSILLSGSPTAISQLCELLEDSPIDIVFGGQFTIDQIIRRQDLIFRLARNGLRYIFIGLETFDPDEIGGMSKDLGKKENSWQNRFLAALDILTNANILCGCALLFGLGEKHENRLALVNQIIHQRTHSMQPTTVSANWAVQHPLKGIPESEGETYIRWGTPKGPFLDVFHRFGEASTEYPIAGVARPTLVEVQEIIELLDEFERINV